MSANSAFSVGGATISGGALVYLGTQTASNQATVDFDQIFSTSYNAYIVIFNSLVPVTDAVQLQLQLGTGSTPTWISANYAWNGSNSSNVSTNSTSDSAISLVGGNATYYVKNTAAYGVNGSLLISNTNGSSNVAFITSEISFLQTGVTLPLMSYVTGYQPAAIFTSLRLKFSSGNISSGSVSIYGIAAS